MGLEAAVLGHLIIIRQLVRKIGSNAQKAAQNQSQGNGNAFDKFFHNFLLSVAGFTRKSVHAYCSTRGKNYFDKILLFRVILPFMTLKAPLLQQMMERISCFGKRKILKILFMI